MLVDKNTRRVTNEAFIVPGFPFFSMVNNEIHLIVPMYNYFERLNEKIGDFEFLISEEKYEFKDLKVINLITNKSIDHKLNIKLTYDLENKYNEDDLKQLNAKKDYIVLNSDKLDFDLLADYFELLIKIDSRNEATYEEALVEIKRNM